MKFTELLTQISGIDSATRLCAGQALQQILRLRNARIGGADRRIRTVGRKASRLWEALMRTLAWLLAHAGCEDLSWRNPHNYRRLASAYAGRDAARLGQPWVLSSPRIVQTSAELNRPRPIRRTSAELAVSQSETAGFPRG